jgi:tripartite-type tricarboxylate transporter receptor subunit TctC
VQLGLIARALSALVLLAGCDASARAEDFYKGKSISLYVGNPPGGGMDNEMRLVARFFGGTIPGEPTIVPRNMQGAGGVVLGNHLYNIARPDGLTLGMPGRSGFLLAPVTTVGDVKYDLKKFTWIGSSASTNYLLLLRKALNIRNLDDLKNTQRQLIIGASGATTANSVVPDVLAKYEKFPFKVVRGYPGMNDVVIALERGEVDGMLTHRGTLRADLITSSAFVPIFQTFALEPDLPALENFITNDRERRLLALLNAPLRIGLPLIAPPGLPEDLTRTLRQSYFKMVSSREYQDEATKRGFDVGAPNVGDELARFVSDNLTAVPADVLQEYRAFVEHP